MATALATLAQATLAQATQAQAPLDLDNTTLLALGATVLCGTLAVAGAHTYVSGRAQRQALVDRLAGSQGARSARRRAAYDVSRPSTADCAAPASAARSTCGSRRRAST